MEIARPFGFPVTNSMVVTWVVALGLIVFAQLATRNMKQVPEGAQDFSSGSLKACMGSSRGCWGRSWRKRPSGSSRTVFIFILASNWLGLVPGVGSMGWGH